LIHRATAEFKALKDELPDKVRKLADKNFEILKSDPRHPSLQLKKVGRYWSVRVGEDYRAVGRKVEGGFSWFWIGVHDEYIKLIRRK
jgi:mRNA-degrading endonuclease RelE of RelBE toxin-antitoxin system